MAHHYEMSPSGGEQSNSLAASVSTGILGFVLGTSLTFIVMQPIDAEQPKNANGSRPPSRQTAASPVAGEGVPATEISRKDLRGGGGRGSRGAKRALATLVGKLELLSRPTMILRVEFESEQAKGIAAKLEELNHAETMFSEEAEEYFYAIERFLTSEQKEVIAEIALPIDVGFSPPVVGSEPATGVSVSIGTPVTGTSMSPGGGGRRDQSPFTQEINQIRLRELLARLSPSAPEVMEKSD